jgi:hypothetical protein
MSEVEATDAELFAGHLVLLSLATLGNPTRIVASPHGRLPLPSHHFGFSRCDPHRVIHRQTRSGLGHGHRNVRIPGGHSPACDTASLSNILGSDLRVCTNHTLRHGHELPKRNSGH